MSEPLLSVADLRTYFATDAGVVRAVDGMTFEVGRGEVLGLVGESGAGKTVAARSILRLVDDPGRIVDGEVRFRDRTLVGVEESPSLDSGDGSDSASSLPDSDFGPEALSEAAMREEVRGTEIATIFQDPSASLNPVRAVGAQVREVVAANRDCSGDKAREVTVELLREVGLPDAASRYDAYPHQLSAGMCQRVVVAMALGCQPSLIVADEPTSALDPTVEGQIVDLLLDAQARHGTSILWITHDVALVAAVCDRVAVAYAGEIVEEAPVDALFYDTGHPYTEALLDATPAPHESRERLDPIQGSMPEAIDPPGGCRFHPRCPHAREVCTEVRPDCRPVGDGDISGDDPAPHRTACLRDDAFADVDYEGSPPLDGEGSGATGPEATDSDDDQGGTRGT